MEGWGGAFDREPTDSMEPDNSMPNKREAIERLRDNALYIEGWEPPTDFRVSVRLDDLRTLLSALSDMGVSEEASLFSLNLKSVAKRERNIGNRELSELLDAAALMIDRSAMQAARLTGLAGERG
jgi:hypothetical protein